MKMNYEQADEFLTNILKKNKNKCSSDNYIRVVAEFRVSNPVLSMSG
jgi:hypothetical protein